METLVQFVKILQKCKSDDINTSNLEMYNKLALQFDTFNSDEKDGVVLAVVELNSFKDNKKLDDKMKCTGSFDNIIKHLIEVRDMIKIDKFQIRCKNAISLSYKIQSKLSPRNFESFEVRTLRTLS